MFELKEQPLGNEISLWFVCVWLSYSLLIRLEDNECVFVSIASCKCVCDSKLRLKHLFLVYRVMSQTKQRTQSHGLECFSSSHYKSCCCVNVAFVSNSTALHYSLILSIQSISPHCYVRGVCLQCILDWFCSSLLCAQNLTIKSVHPSQ